MGVIGTGVSRGTADGLWVRFCFSGVQVPPERELEILELERSGHSENIPTFSRRRGNASCSDDFPDTPATTISNYSLSVQSLRRDICLSESEQVLITDSIWVFLKWKRQEECYSCCAREVKTKMAQSFVCEGAQLHIKRGF